MNSDTPSSKNLDPSKICPKCGQPLHSKKSQADFTQTPSLGFTSTEATLVAGHLPQNDQVQFAIGPYQVLNKIGQGGMGEVFLAYDTVCGRRIALKRIRTDLLSHQQMHRRFLKEARVTSQLTHPAIIPIYTIHDEDNLVYYTMPYVEGETLKQILRNARAKEKLGQKPDHSTGTISSLIRIFLSICQAVGYAHSKGVLHRDLKPENVIVGKYGEVLILDWGLAKLINRENSKSKSTKEDEDDDLPLISTKAHPLHGLTNLGKVVGTISYMAPERAMGEEATVQTDIYSLGVILYQILTLRYPFQRKNLKEFRKNMQNEVLHEPALIAPYRDVPRVLAQMTMKCLVADPTQRYKNVDDFLYDLESFIEGRAEWFPAAELSIDQKSDWEFQENVLIAEHMAITRGMDVSDWVSLMISKDSFDEPIKIEAEVVLGDKSHGVGILLSVPEVAERVHLNDGYTLWLSSELYSSTKLLRSTVEVFHSPDTLLKLHERYHLRIEKIDRHIYFYLNGVLQFSYLGLLPIVGTHIGLLARDSNFTISKLKVFVGSQNIMVNCLAVPDAFLAHKDYTKALSEYRRIGYAFPGRAEGREALFRAGITLLEQAQSSESGKQDSLYEQAFAEFEKLHNTPGAPLEYLGKALIYQSLKDFEEELKCYELALRRFPDHPLLSVLKEQILYRMHESSRYDRRVTYCFILLVTRHMSETIQTGPVKKLLESLQKHWEKLYFIEASPSIETNETLANLNFAIQLAFWLAKPYSLTEIVDQLETLEVNKSVILGNLYFCLIELGCWEYVQKKLPNISLDQSTAHSLNIIIEANANSLESAVSLLLKWKNETHTRERERCILYIMAKAIDEEKNALIKTIASHFASTRLSPDCRLQMQCYEIWSALSHKEWRAAGDMLQNYSIEQLGHETSLLHFLYGCWLYATEGSDIANIHYYGVLETVHPRTWALFSHYYNQSIVENYGWHLKAFLYEKRQLYRQARLFYQITGNELEEERFKALAQSCYIDGKSLL